MVLHRVNSQRRKTTVHQGKKSVGLPANFYLCDLARGIVLAERCVMINMQYFNLESSIERFKENYCYSVF